MNGNDVVAIARTWLGTPYHHQAAVKGAGCDCLGLIRGVYVEVEGKMPEDPPPYTPDWAEASGRETLLEAARRHLVEKPADRPLKPGDVVLFRLKRGYICKHAGIVSYNGKMIHAQEGLGTVEVNMVDWYKRRITAAFMFPRVAKAWQQSS